MSDMEQLQAHLDKRLDTIEGKLDSHLERISKAETSLEWVRGYIKVSITVFVALVSGALKILWDHRP